MRRIAPLLFTLALTFLPARADALTVRDVIELTRAGLGEEVLLALIEVDRSIFPIDAATIKDAAKQYLNTQSVVKVTLFPEKKNPAN